MFFSIRSFLPFFFFCLAIYNIRQPQNVNIINIIWIVVAIAAKICKHMTLISNKLKWFDTIILIWFDNLYILDEYIIITHLFFSCVSYLVVEDKSNRQAKKYSRNCFFSFCDMMYVWNFYLKRKRKKKTFIYISILFILMFSRSSFVQHVANKSDITSTFTTMFNTN